VTQWLAENEYARALVHTEYEDDFTFEDLVDHLGGGFDDQRRTDEKLKDTDLARYFRDAGILGLEVAVLKATELRGSNWELYDSLITEDAE
jgi:hypothetical protein